MSKQKEIRSGSPRYDRLAVEHDSTDMPRLFRGLKSDTRDTLYFLATSRRGRRLIIGYLRDMHQKNLEHVREWNKRNTAPHINKH